MNESNLYLYNKIFLNHHGTVTLLGISPDLTAYVEEMYDDETWLARYSVSKDGLLTLLGDEDSGKTPLKSFDLPMGSIRPQSAKQTHALNFTGPRQRGMVEEDRIREMARPLSIQAKMQIAELLNLKIPAPMILGITESYVISEAQLSETTFVVCRRIQIAHALTNPQIDAQGNTYNYDSLRLNIAHLYSPDMDNEVPVEVALQGLPQQQLNYPLDCVIHEDLLWIADGGTPQTKGSVCIWKIVR